MQICNVRNKMLQFIIIAKTIKHLENICSKQNGDIVRFLFKWEEISSAERIKSDRTISGFQANSCVTEAILIWLHQYKYYLLTNLEKLNDYFIVLRSIRYFDGKQVRNFFFLNTNLMLLKFKY